MIYSQEIVIPSNTMRDFPIRSEIDIVEGVVKRVWVRWRWGSADLGGAAIFREGSQIWPTTGGEWFYSSIHETVFDEMYVVGEEPLHFVVRSFNEDDSFAHKLWIGFSVIRPRYTQGLMEFMEFISGGGGA